MAENSFDIVSKVDLQEVSNAVQQALKEIHTRYDLKDSKSDIQLDAKEELVLTSADEYKLKAVTDVLQGKLVKRGVSLKSLTYGAVEPAAADQLYRAVGSISANLAEGYSRVSGKDRDTLQQIIAMLKQSDFGIDMQFTNYRSN